MAVFLISAGAIGDLFHDESRISSEIRDRALERVLYLRSYRDDGVLEISNAGIVESVDLKQSLRAEFPSVMYIDPGDPAAGLEDEALTNDLSWDRTRHALNEKWKNIAYRMMRRSAAIFVVQQSTAGVAWEDDALWNFGMRKKAVFAIPNVRGDRDARLRSLFDVDALKYDISLVGGIDWFSFPRFLLRFLRPIRFWASCSLISAAFSIPDGLVVVFGDMSPSDYPKLIRLKIALDFSLVDVRKLYRKSLVLDGPPTAYYRHSGDSAARLLLISLWDQAGGRPNYVKSDWLELEKLVLTYQSGNRASGSSRRGGKLRRYVRHSAPTKEQQARASELFKRLREFARLADRPPGYLSYSDEEWNILEDLLRSYELLAE